MTEYLGITLLYKLWFPMGIWTILTIAIVLLSHRSSILHPSVRYQVLWFVIGLLPIGLVAISIFPSPILHKDSAILILPDRELEKRIIHSATSIPFNANQESDLEVAMPIRQPSKTADWWHVLNGVSIGFAGLACLWAFLRIARLIHEHLGLIRFRQSLSEVSIAWQKAALQRINLPYEVQITHSENLHSPITFGWSNPYIVLPTPLLEDQDSARIAILHELSHIRHHDFAQQYFLRFLDAIFAINPMMRYLILQLETEREILRDQEVVHQSEIPVHVYATTLYKLATSYAGKTSFTNA